MSRRGHRGKSPTPTPRTQTEASRSAADRKERQGQGQGTRPVAVMLNVTVHRRSACTAHSAGDHAHLAGPLPLQHPLQAAPQVGHQLGGDAALQRRQAGQRAQHRRQRAQQLQQQRGAAVEAQAVQRQEACGVGMGVELRRSRWAYMGRRWQTNEERLDCAPPPPPTPTHTLPPSPHLHLQRRPPPPAHRARQRAAACAPGGCGRWEAPPPAPHTPANKQVRRDTGAKRTVVDVARE